LYNDFKNCRGFSCARGTMDHTQFFTKYCIVNSDFLIVIQKIIIVFNFILILRNWSRNLFPKDNFDKV
jgi:hypothetical protein